MNCSYRVLHSNDVGYITQCESCKRIQVAFGTTLFQLTEEECKHFRKFIARELDKYSDYNFPSEKSFIYSTDSSKVRMIFSLVEMKALDDLLAQSFLMLEILRVT